MTRRLAIIILYLGSLLTVLFFKVAYSRLIGVGLTLLFFAYLIVDHIFLAKKKFAGEFVFNKQRHSIRYVFFLLAIIPTIGYFTSGTLNVVQATVFWSAMVFEVVTAIINHKLKPVGLVI